MVHLLDNRFRVNAPSTADLVEYLMRRYCEHITSCLRAAVTQAEAIRCNHTNGHTISVVITVMKLLQQQIHYHVGVDWAPTSPVAEPSSQLNEIWTRLKKSHDDMCRHLATLRGLTYGYTPTKQTCAECAELWDLLRLVDDDVAEQISIEVEVLHVRLFG